MSINSITVRNTGSSDGRDANNHELKDTDIKGTKIQGKSSLVVD
jgi:hypothetical protein